MAIALVTGATAGIGAQYARLLAKEGFDLILVARDKKRLGSTAKSLSKEFGVKVEVLPADLTKPVQLEKVRKRLSDNKKPIEVLINNAGFGINKSFLISNLSDEQGLIRRFSYCSYAIDPCGSTDYEAAKQRNYCKCQQCGQLDSRRQLQRSKVLLNSFN
jgi:NAD(P)-dependent dehydrogenase (short-subunit alcohol dehydrogenase family)